MHYLSYFWVQELETDDGLMRYRVVKLFLQTKMQLSWNL